MGREERAFHPTWRWHHFRYRFAPSTAPCQVFSGSAITPQLSLERDAIARTHPGPEEQDTHGNALGAMRTFCLRTPISRVAASTRSRQLAAPGIALRCAASCLRTSSCWRTSAIWDAQRAPPQWCRHERFVRIPHPSTIPHMPKQVAAV